MFVYLPRVSGRLHFVVRASMTEEDCIQSSSDRNRLVFVSEI